MKTISERIRTELLPMIARIVPAGVIEAKHQCGLCGKPASLIVGRNSRRQPTEEGGEPQPREFIVPVVCGHWPYPADEDPKPPYIPSEQTFNTVHRLIHDADFWNVQCLPLKPKRDTSNLGERANGENPGRTVSNARAAYRKARKAGRGAYVAA